jgi:hypothetical protein
MNDAVNQSMKINYLFGEKFLRHVIVSVDLFEKERALQELHPVSAKKITG